MLGANPSVARWDPEEPRLEEQVTTWQGQKYSIADRNVFALPESFCALNRKTVPSDRNFSRLPGIFSLIVWQAVWTVWNLSGQSGFCLGSLETNWTVLKLSGQS